MISVMLVDDHVLIRKGIVLLLEEYTDVEVVGEVGDGEDAILCAAKTKPDVILMDISIPNGLDGFTASQEIMKMLPNVKILLLTMHHEITFIQKAIEINAHGYLLKKSHGGTLYEAIFNVYHGKTFYDVDLPKKQLDKLFKQRGNEKKSLLTVREHEIVRLMILGYTNMEIANKLHISNKTVESHKANIMQKLHLKKKSELIQYGLANNFVTWKQD